MTYNQLFKNKYVIFISLIRVSGYVYMLFQPLYGMLLSMVLDMLDWIIFSFAKLQRKDYDKMDKLLDYLQSLFLIPLLFNTYIFNAYMLLLAYRTIGQIIYFFTHKKAVFLLFPNFAEYLALLYYIKIHFNFDFELSSMYVVLPLIAFKIFQEYWVHIKKKSYTWNLGRDIRTYVFHE